MGRRVTILIPAYNEASNLLLLHDEIKTVMRNVTDDYEVIVVNDGSSDKTQKAIENLHSRDPSHIVGIQLRSNFGKASALQIGFEQARGGIVITMDADMQDDPKEIPRFIAKIESGFDLVSGWKQNRKDSFIKNNSSKFFNFVTSLFSKVKLHDFNCGFKAYRSETAKSLDLHGQLHRYIPVIAANQGYRVCEIPVHHRKRKYGKSKYGSIRFINGFLDLLTVIILTRYFKRPAHFFGGFGSIALALGFIIGLYIERISICSGLYYKRLAL